MNNNFMWTYFLQLGSNMWNEEGNTRGRVGRSNSDASPVLRFDRELWDAYVLRLKDCGVNTLLIDVGEAMRYESHPEIAVKGSWTHDEMRKEVERLQGLGFEVIPKLNFSACHDVWLGDYSRMLSTPIYYEVCKDLIKEVCDVFKPKYFHLGMDEETAAHQRNFDYAVIRQFDLWWKDFYYLVDCVESENVRSWIWSDYIWNHPDEFLAKMPKSVLQSNWYYSNKFEDLEESKAIRLTAIDLMEQHGFDQVPTGSVYSYYENLEGLTKYSAEHISKEHFLGMMQTTWERIAGPWMDRHHAAADSLLRSKQWLDANG